MPRTDRKSSSYLSTAIYAVFISIFLFGVYMMTSTTVIPVNMVPAVDKNKPEIREQVQMDDTRTSEDTNIGDANDDSEDKMSRENEAIQEDSAVETEKGNESSTNVNFEDEKTQVADGENTTENETENGLKPKSDQTEIQKKEEKGVDVSAVELLTETNSTNGDWKSQTEESKKEKEQLEQSSSKGVDIVEYSWKLCNTAAGADYIPCLDNIKAIKQLHSTKHYEHRERHCPEESPACLVPLPEGYRRSIKWPKSRDKIWFYNVPHTQLVKYKGHQNWVKVDGDYLTFPGGGTQFKYGALHYIDTIQSAYPDIAWGKRSRVILDVGCGVASFGGYMFERDVLTMSFAPKDEHEAQVQFALERGIPAISAVMGTKRLPFPSRVYDVVHCARCRVPWHIEGGMLLLELNRLLRPGGYFVWSATPVYQKLPEDAGIWKAMSDLTKSMCWEMVKKTKDKVNRVGFAIFRKPVDNKCYEQRSQNTPPLCQESDEPNAAWNVPLQACMHRVPVDSNMRGSQWPEQWPQRLEATPYWLNSSETGVYGKSAPEDFEADYQHWKQVVEKSYLSGMRIDWSNVRNVMDMSSIYGGFAAALRERKVWVMNVVTVDSPDALPIIFERGLFGIYHDWCESFSTYPRTYDLLHADHLFSKIKKRCKILPVIAEVDRVLRPKGNLIVRDNKETIQEIEAIAKSLHWNVQMTYFQGTEGLLYAQKMMWRPQETETSI